MRTIVLILLLSIPKILIAQDYDPNDDGCRMISAKGLNLAYAKWNSFNAYTKEKNLYVYFETKIEASYDRYKQVDDAKRRLKEMSKDYIYNTIVTMDKCGVFSNADVEVCTFQSLYFNSIIITSDYVKIPFKFTISYNVLVEMKDRLNKDEVLMNLFSLN